MSDTTNLPNKFIQIDEEGYFHFGENRVSDQSDGFQLLSDLKILDSCHLITKSSGHDALVEAFDEPFIALDIYKKETHWFIQMPYEYETQINLNTLCLDEWDRFHGEDTKGIPFVLSRSAQSHFFNLVDEYDDDSITINGEKLKTGDWLSPNHDTKAESYWTDIYNTEDPGWDIKVPHPSLEQVMQQTKLNKCRILTLGCGTGTDAHFFAKLGHIVTAVDFSPEAIKKAQEKYKDMPNLKFVQKDLFDITKKEFGEFDLIYEHTLYCAISPDRRNLLLKKWKEMLTDTGQIIGVFFTMHKRSGPPFGGSEWEIRQRLKKDFRFLYWTRSKLSPKNRLGKELIIFAQKY